MKRISMRFDEWAWTDSSREDHIDRGLCRYLMLRLNQYAESWTTILLTARRGRVTKPTNAGRRQYEKCNQAHTRWYESFARQQSQ